MECFANFSSLKRRNAKIIHEMSVKLKLVFNHKLTAGLYVFLSQKDIPLSPDSVEKVALALRVKH